jgi:branched-chain amino acid transport system substrate-binding protein
MRKPRPIRISLLVLAAILVAAPVHAEDGVGKDAVSIGYFSVMTGPVNLSGTSGWDGFRLYVDEVNRKGGVHGRKVTLVGPYDEACKPSEAVAVVNKLIHQDKVFALAGGGCSGATLAALPAIKDARIPFLITISTHVKFMQPVSPNVFRAGTVPDDILTTALADAAVKNFGARKVAILYVANDYGKGGAAGITKRLEKYKVTPVLQEPYNVGDSDFSAQVLRLKRESPDLVFLYAYHKEAGIIVRQAVELGLKTKWLGSGATSTPLFPQAAGDAGTGFVSVQPIPALTESDQPDVASYRAKLSALYPGGLPAGRPSDYDMFNYGGAKVLVEALQRAGADLTRQRFIDALESLRNVQTGTTFPVSFSKDDHEGSKGATFIEILPGGKRRLLPFTWSPTD